MNTKRREDREKRNLEIKTRRRKNKLIRDIQTFVDKGETPNQILKYIEKRYDEAFKEDLAKMGKIGKFHGRTKSSMRDIFDDSGFDKNILLKGLLRK